MVARAEIRKKLDAFIAPVKEGSDLASGSPPFPTAKRAPILAASTKTNAKGKIYVEESDVTGVVNDATYTKLCGLTHLTEVTNWINGGKLTSCNSFTGTAGVAMGAKIFLGAFNLEELLTKHKKQHALIPWGKGEKPDYGDIFSRWTTDQLHQGVSLGFVDGQWKTIEGGQGGPGGGVDFIGRRTRNFEKSQYDGFVDMAMFLDARGPMPDWMKGTWVIYCGKDVYYYKIKRTYEVEQFPWQPSKAGGEAVSEPIPIDTGEIAMLPGERFEIAWSKEGGRETFEYLRWDSFPGIMEKIKGKSSRGEELRGVRL